MYTQTHMNTHTLKHTVSHDLGHINSPSDTLIRSSISINSFDSWQDVAKEGAFMHISIHMDAVLRGATSPEVHFNKSFEGELNKFK